MSSELVTKNFIEKLSKDNFESYLFNLEDEAKKVVFDICIELQLLKVHHVQKLLATNNLQFFSVKAMLQIIPMMVESGELKVSQEFIKEAYKRIYQKNLLNHLSKISDLRKEFFPKDIDLLLSDFSLHLVNQDYLKGKILYNELCALLESNWRKVSHSKPHDVYLEELNVLLESVKDKNSLFFKLYCQNKKELSDFEKMQFLILSSSSEDELKEALAFLDIEKSKPIVAVKKINVTKIENTEELESLDSFSVDLKNIIQTSEDERKNLIQKYLGFEEKTIETNESYVLSLLKTGHFDEVERKSDLVLTFFEVGYEKAIEKILELYEDLEAKLTFAQLLSRDGREDEARIIAAEVLASNNSDLSLVEWANRLIDR